MHYSIFSAPGAFCHFSRATLRRFKYCFARIHLISILVFTHWLENDFSTILNIKWNQSWSRQNIPQKPSEQNFLFQVKITATHAKILRTDHGYFNRPMLFQSAYQQTTTEGSVENRGRSLAGPSSVFPTRSGTNRAVQSLITSRDCLKCIAQ